MNNTRAQLTHYLPLYLGLLSLGITLGACSAPKVNLKSAALTRLTTTGLNVALDMNVNNPNSYKIPLNSLSWDLKLFRAPFNNGSLNLNKQIRKGNNPVKVPLGMRFSSAALGIQKFASGKNIPWNIGGQCNFRSPVGKFNVKYGKGGTWANPLRGKSFKGIKIGQLDPPQEQPHTEHAKLSITLDQVPLM